MLTPFFRGKFYELGDKGQEISATQINKIVINADDKAYVCACGRSDSATGTSGTFELYQDNTFICQINWNCPYIGSNSFHPQKVSSKGGYIVSDGGWPTDGPLGVVNVEIAKKA
ncbi:aegerolysin type hemolysin [Nemania serpens]|nr:aegerolysin type hemolysin [Nemania serpens]